MPIHSIFLTLQKKINRRVFFRRAAMALSLLVAGASGKTDKLSARSVRRSTLTDPATRPADNIYVGVIGDYGREDRDVSYIAGMIRSWEPDIITTVGDNIYEYESLETVDNCVGQYFNRFLSPYEGKYGVDSGVNRFYPILGNHDWESVEIDEQGVCTGPYFDFFPNRERYYTFQKGPIRFFMLDSDENEPDGTNPLSVQAMWLRDQLALSDATWNLVYLHHSPLSSGIMHGSHAHLQWPFAQWGAHAVLSGHNHTYERIAHDGIVHLINGLGGTSKHGLSKPRMAGSQAGYTGTFGAMLIAANAESITFQFINRHHELVDEHTIVATPTQTPPAPEENQNVETFSLSKRVANTTDNAIERLADGALIPTGTLLDFGINEHIVGNRFDEIMIPANATIVDARIELTASEPNSEPASAQIQGEKSCFAQAYNQETKAITQRTGSYQHVEWGNIEPWTTVGASHWTPNLAAIVQEIINQPTWQEGNTLAFTFSGQGRRPAASYQIQPAAAPQLHIRYTVPIESAPAAVVVSEGTEKQRTFMPAIITDQCEIIEDQ